MSAPYYADEWVTLYHGDAHDVVPALSRADLVLTDPPFFMPAQHYASRAKWQRSWGDTSILARWWDGVVAIAVDRLRETGNLLVFCDDESYPVFYPPIYARFDVLNALVWDKGSFGMGATWRHAHEFVIAGRWRDSKWCGGHGRSDVLRYKVVPSADREHPVDKPLGLLGDLIRATTDEGDIVLDPFVGGGSTLLSARISGRKAIGIEIDEAYCEIAAKRLSQEVLDFGAAS